MTEPFIDIVFDGPPGHESGRFVEVETPERASISYGEWLHRDDGYWVLRIHDSRAEATRLRKLGESLATAVELYINVGECTDAEEVLEAWREGRQ